MHTYFRYGKGDDYVLVIANNTKETKQVAGTRFTGRTTGFTAGTAVVSGAITFNLQPLKATRPPGAGSCVKEIAYKHLSWGTTAAYYLLQKNYALTFTA